MALTRRTFLLATGSVPAVLAAADGWPGRDRWERLRRRLSGPLFRPADAGYETARQGFMALYDQRPAAVARCLRGEDVQRCVEFAAAHRIPISARSGGHSYAGYSTVDGGLVVDLSRLNAVRVGRDGRAEIGPGARLGPIYAALGGAGRLLPAGTSPVVGIAGLALGGGIGVLARKYGLTCDRLVAARLVTADGRLHTVSAESEPDLLWALRGGGGGNFGIVISFTFDTAPALGLSVFELEFPPAAMAALLAVWPAWQQAMPDELWTNCGLAADRVVAGGCFVGPAAKLRPMVDELVRRVGTPPVKRAEVEKDYLATMTHYAGCADLGGPSCAPSWNGGGGAIARGSYVAASRMLRRPFTDPDAVARLFGGDPELYTIMDGFGGAIAEVGPAESAFPHRDVLASIQVLHGVAPVPGGEAAARRAVGVVRDGLGEDAGTTGYVNYIDPEMPDWARAYYGRNLPRLRAVARRYDPDRLFAFPQGVD
ncbi:FAD-binding oxidoreductase [Amycolatopsis sp. NPDC059021]|uniref:FAD-binding oxidoreductase n=1 Tax=Amycolatopsis sp. NPDC059021 TaxID=3346704 RepID=UPI00366E4554